MCTLLKMGNVAWNCSCAKCWISVQLPGSWLPNALQGNASYRQQHGMASALGENAGVQVSEKV